MSTIVFELTTAGLLVLMFKGGMALVGESTVGGRGVPWAAVLLTAIALAGVATQLCWSGAWGAFDDDPAKSGWWRVLTSVFVQNGGVGGAVWNIGTIAVIAALASWFWGGPLTLALFLAGVLLPERVDRLWGHADRATADPRNFAGSSGATYFLAATLAAALLVQAGSRAVRDRNDLLLALAAPAAGLAMWFAQSNGHGLVAAYGFAIGLAVRIAAAPLLKPDRYLEHPPRLTIGSLIPKKA